MRREKTEITIDLDEKDLVDEIYFKDPNTKNKQGRKINAFVLGFWDRTKNDSFHLEMWKKGFFTHEMKRLCVATIGKIGELIQRSTSDQSLADEIIQFSKKLEKQMEK